MRFSRLRQAVVGVLSVAIVATFGAPAGAGKEPSETTGFDGETITLGVITPRSGLVSIIGNPLTAGNEMFWDYYNQ